MALSNTFSRKIIMNPPLIPAFTYETDKIFLRFIRSKSIVSRAIQWQSWGAWSHVEFAFRDGYYGADFSGVRLRPSTYCAPSDVLLCYASVTLEQARGVYDFAYSQIRKSYDFTSLFGFLLRRDWREPDSWFCSELVAAAFEAGGLPLLRTTECNRISPSMLSLSPLLKNV